MTMKELAERVEAATGPDRELDEAIADELLTEKQRHCIAGLSDAEGGMWMWRYPDGSVGTALRYTGSEDAAVTLVPYDCAVIHHTQWWPFGKRTTSIYDGMRRIGIGRAKTRATAFTAAALRAIASQETTR